MKKILISLLLIFSTVASGESKLQVNWFHDYDEALKVAKEKDKNIYLYISANTCPLCKKFKAKTLSRKCVKARLKDDFIALNLERNTNFVPEKFEKFGAPRHYFLDKNGKILFEINGVFEPKSFMEILDDIEMYEED
mgnify:CR=1 FL=1